MKAAKIVMVELHPGRDGSASSPSTVPASPRSAAAESLSGFVLWELISVFGQREHDPETFSPYELRNGPAADREPARLAQENEKWTRACSEGLTASQSALDGSYGPYDHIIFMGNA